MKIRQGFVSNSSSTSFCIIGVCIQTPQQYLQSEQELYIDHVNSHLYKANLDKFLTAYYNYDYQTSVYLGAPIQNMKDSQTLYEFKQRVKQAILTIAPNIMYKPQGQLTVQFFEQSWTS